MECLYSLIIIKLCQPKEEITEETSLTEVTQMSSAALIAPRCVPRIKPSRDSRCATWLTAQARETLKTTLHSIKSTSTCPRSTSSSNIALLAAFTLVLFVFVPLKSVADRRVSVSSVTPPNSEVTSVLKHSLDQQPSHSSSPTDLSSSVRKTPRRNESSSRQSDLFSAYWFEPMREFRWSFTVFTTTVNSTVS